MENCLHCGTKLTHVPGRKQKSFCNVNCRNKYFYAQRQNLIKNAMESFKGEKIIYSDKEATEIASNISLQSETQPIKDEANQKRIAELRNELKNPPKNPQIGLRKWIAVRENEIKTLEAKT